MKNIFLVLALCTALFAEGNTLSIGSISDNGAGEVTFTIDYDLEDAVGGFQFNLLSGTDLAITGASGGDAGAAGMMISTSAGTVIGFSLSLATVGPGAGDFVTVTATYDTAVNGTDVGVWADHTCDDDGTVECDDGDTVFLLSDVGGVALESTFSTGCWTVGSSDMCSILDNEHPIYAFELSKNYPNPFNPTTTINYEVAIAGDVSIVIYDMVGREVKTLVSNYANPGSYSSVWNAKNNEGIEVSAGMYVYKMIAGDFVSVNKMLLEK